MIKIKYMIELFFIMTLIVHGYYCIWKTKKHLHILQLNSYFNNRYLTWLKRKKTVVFNFKELFPLIALIGMFFQMPIIILILLIISYLRLFISRPKTQEKKPLVFTYRAKRIFFTNIILIITIYAYIVLLWWYKGDFWLRILPIILVAHSFFIPISLMLTNLLILPLEKFIQYRYFRDAYNKIRTTPNLKIIGITGSFGKTTTKHIAGKILQNKFNTLITPGSYNTTMGVTKVIRCDLKPTHEVFIAEMSAKKPGDIKELCELVQPQYGLITAIGEQHLETFKSLENIKKTKNELIESLPHQGMAFFNIDDPNLQELSKITKCHTICYGIESPEMNLDYLAKDLCMNEHGSNFTVIRKRDNSNASFSTKLLGKYNIYNILGAIALASELGIELHEMIYPIKQLQSVPHRLELKPIGNGIIFIDDAFNSNPIGSKMALEVLKQISGKRKIIITPGMIELGEKEDFYNEHFGENIADICDYVILVGKKQTTSLQRGLKTKDFQHNKLFIASDFAEAKLHLEQILQSGDIVLFENDLPDNYA